jgi:hypothetical protein
VAEGTHSYQFIADYIWANYPERARAKSVQKGNPGVLYPEEGVYGVDNTKSKRLLGLEYNSFEAMLGELLLEFIDLEGNEA